jgi:hypothetical protein
MIDYWDELVNLFSPMIYMVKKRKLDPNGSELRFIISEQRKEDRNTTPLVNMVKARRTKLKGESNLALRLEDIFNDYRKKSQPNTPWRKPSPKAISLYIFTDGVWQHGSGQLKMVAKAIQSLVEYLVEQGSPQKIVGIQFIQFGNDPQGTERLRWLDEDLQEEFGLERDICDTTPADGNVWKMLLGSINDYWDDDKPKRSPTSSSTATRASRASYASP